jgi:radical SAM protein with 4Fe4S-binding SPASM domain
LELRTIAIPPAKPFMLNSQPKRVCGNAWYETHIRLISRDIRIWTGYVSLIWLKNSEGNLTEVGRVIEWLRTGDREYAIRGRAPQEASNVLIGLRINCEGANTNPLGHGTVVHLEFEDLDHCEINPMHGFRPQLVRLANRLRGLSSTIDLNIEMVSYCNLRCLWCSLDHSKAKRIMEPGTLGITLNEIRSSKIPVRRIDLHNAGETLLHPALGRMLGLLGSARSQCDDFPYTGLLTNATVLDSSRSETILNSNAVDLLRFSVDGGNREEFEMIRKGARWEQVAGNIRRFIDMNDKAGHHVAPGIICIVRNEHPLMTDWMSEEFRELLGLVDFVELRRPHNWDGSVDLGLGDEPSENGVCPFMKSNNLVVLPTGDVTVCCADLNGRGIVGNVTTGLANLVNSRQRRDMISLMKRNRRKEIRLCANCSQPSVPEGLD